MTQCITPDSSTATGGTLIDALPLVVCVAVVAFLAGAQWPTGPEGTTKTVQTASDTQMIEDWHGNVRRSQPMDLRSQAGPIAR